MSDDITVDLDYSIKLYETYHEILEITQPISQFTFDDSKSIDDNLDALALFSIDPATTLPCYYSYKSIFLDIIARWVCKYQVFESSLHLGNAISGSRILAALGRLVGISQPCLNLIEYYVSRINFFDLIKQNLTQISHIELQEVLLTFYRLSRFDNPRFKQFIAPEVLYDIINLPHSDFSICKYLSIQILSNFLDASEFNSIKIIQTHLGEQANELYGSYETDSKVNYKFLLLLEAKRLSNFSKLPSSIPHTPSNTVVIESSNLCPLVTSICGVLIPHIITSDVLSSSTDSLQASTFVATPNSISVLQLLARCIQNNLPVMLYGQAGAGKTFLINQLAKYMAYENSIVKIHLGEQTDSKLLLGTYTSGEQPGTFKWRSGVLTTAVQEGKWVVIEDIDRAPTEVLSVLLTLLEKRELSIPSRGEVIKAKNGFQLISTVRISNDSQSVPDLIGSRLWKLCKVDVPSNADLRNILVKNFPLLKKLINSFIKCYEEIVRIYSLSSFISLNNGSHPRVISFRDLMKFCSRCNRMFQNEGITSSDQLLDSTIYDNIFAEAVDCFGSALTEYAALTPLINVIGSSLEIPTSRVELFLSKNVPAFFNDDDSLKIGRAKLTKSSVDKALYRASNNSSFARTNHSLKLMEQIGVSVQMVEPVLLVGETGTGKTTVVQQVAKLLNKKNHCDQCFATN
jgi:midasin